MPRFGRNPFPRRFGGGRHTVEIIHEAMLDQLEPGWDKSEDTENYAELYAHALAVTMIWALNARLAGRMIPARMIETLPTWEAACTLRPEPGDTLITRRARVAAKMRGLVGNAIVDINAALVALVGSNFLGLVAATPSQDVTYWPGINPGPPGFQWASNRATLGVRLTRLGLDDGLFVALVARAQQMLEDLIPLWMTYQIGTDEGGFVAGVALAGVTLLGGP